mmetsp:Transcript_6578/g.15944  ORF Transcript_6578/g.15944 Transcript_6578/m.15944 type:complete len:269 (-) Transcript_6578:245-1051(-)
MCRREMVLNKSVASEACSRGGLTCKYFKFEPASFPSCKTASDCPTSSPPMCCSSAKSVLRMFCTGVDESKLDLMMSPTSSSSTCTDNPGPLEVLWCPKPCADTNCFSFDIDSIKSTTKDVANPRGSTSENSSGDGPFSNPVILYSVIGGGVCVIVGVFVGVWWHMTRKQAPRQTVEHGRAAAFSSPMAQIVQVSDCLPPSPHVSGDNRAVTPFAYPSVWEGYAVPESAPAYRETAGVASPAVAVAVIEAQPVAVVEAETPQPPPRSNV